MKQYFNDKMSYEQAQRILFTQCDSLSPKERESIKKQYQAIAPRIIKREYDNLPANCLTSGPV